MRRSQFAYWLLAWPADQLVCCGPKTTLQTTSARVALVGVGQEQRAGVVDRLAVGQERLDRTVDVRRGYLGWLMTNRALWERQMLAVPFLGELAGHSPHGY